MVTATRLHTSAQAAAISQVDIKTVYNAIDKKIIDTVSGSVRPRKDDRHHAPKGEDLLRLKPCMGSGLS